MRWPFKNTPSRWFLTIGHSDLFGRAATLDDVRRGLAKIPRNVATVILCHIGLQFDSDDPGSWTEIERDGLRPLFLQPRIRALVDARSLAEPDAPGFAFHRQQVLLALRLAQRFCPDAPVETNPKPYYFALGEVLLRINDVLHADLSNVPDGSSAHLPAMLLPLFAASNPPKTLVAAQFVYDLVQSERFQSDPVLRRALNTFQARIGLTFEQYFYVLIFLVSRFMKLRAGPDGLLYLGDLFAKARDGAAIRKAVDQLATPYAELPAHLQAGDDEAFVRDPTQEPFRSRPLVEFPENRFLCADFTSLKLRLSAGVLWTLVNQFEDKNTRNDLFTARGKAFEAYLHCRLRPLLGERYREGPRDHEGNEITDALVDYDDDVVLLEFKSSLLRDTEKYGFDPAALEKRVTDQFLMREGKFQMGGALERLFGFNGRVRRPPGIVSGRPRVVYPVFVLLDGSLAAPWVEHDIGNLLRKKLDEMRVPARPRIERLTVVSIDDLDQLLSILGAGKKLNNLLRERLKVDPEAKNTFHNFLYDLSVSMGIKKPGPLSQFQQVWNDAVEFWKSQGLSE